MILVALILIPAVGGLLAYAAAWRSVRAAKWIALAAMVFHLGLGVALWARCGDAGFVVDGQSWLMELRRPWITMLHAEFYLALDGLSLLMILLTGFLGVLSVAAAWRVQERVGFFLLNLLLTLAGVTGVFLALDLLLFYAFWEVMLIPMFLLIGIYGNERRRYAAIKFFLFTQAGGLLMLLGILGLYFAHAQRTGEPTLNYRELLGLAIEPRLAFWLMLAFFAGLAVKLPAVPIHTWLADAHEQSPMNGSVDIAGLAIKVGAYGLLRFVVPLFPAAAMEFRTTAMVLGLAGILYGGLLAMGQRDLKRFVAYSSVSHMGFVLLGVFAFNTVAYQGVVMIILASGIGTGALLIVAELLFDRVGSRSMGQMGGLWASLPRLGGLGMFFALAAMGLPAMGSFVGEVLVLAGLAQEVMAGRLAMAYLVLAAGAFVVSVAYALLFVQRVFQGPPAAWLENKPLPRLTPREVGMLSAAAVAMVWLGVLPNGVLKTSLPAALFLREHSPKQAPPAEGERSSQDANQPKPLARGNESEVRP